MLTSRLLLVALSVAGCAISAEEDSNSIENQLNIAASGGNLDGVQELATTSELRQAALQGAVGFAKVQSDYEAKCSIEVIEWLLEEGARVDVEEMPSSSSLARASRNSNCTQGAVDTLLTVTSDDDCDAIRDAMIDDGFEPRFICA